MRSNEITRLAVAAAVDHVTALAICGGDIVEVPIPDDDGTVRRHAVRWRDTVARAKDSRYDPHLKLLVLATAMARHGYVRIGNDTWRRMVTRLNEALRQYGLHELHGDMGSAPALDHQLCRLYGDAADAAMAMVRHVLRDDEALQHAATLPEARATLLFAFMYGAPMYAHAMSVDVTDDVLAAMVRSIAATASAVHGNAALGEAVRAANRMAPPASVADLTLMADRAWRIARADGESHGAAIALFVEPVVEACNLRAMPVSLDG